MTNPPDMFAAYSPEDWHDHGVVIAPPKSTQRGAAPRRSPWHVAVLAVAASVATVTVAASAPAKKDACLVAGMDYAVLPTRTGEGGSADQEPNGDPGVDAAYWKGVRAYRDKLRPLPEEELSEEPDPLY